MWLVGDGILVSMGSCRMSALSGGLITNSHYYLCSGNHDHGALLQVKKVKFSSLQVKKASCVVREGEQQCGCGKS